MYMITTPSGRSFTVPGHEFDALLRELHSGRCRDCAFAPQRHALARDALEAIAEGLGTDSCPESSGLAHETRVEVGGRV